MVDFSVSVSDIVKEARYGLKERFEKYVDVIAYNPTNSTVPHLVVLFTNPKKDYDDPVAKQVRSICIPLENPTMTFAKKSNIDFEPSYEEVIVRHNLPFQVADRQKRFRIKEPKYVPVLPDKHAKGIFHPTLDHFGAETGIEFEEWYEKHCQDVVSYHKIDEGLRVRKKQVYKPKKILPKKQTIFHNGTFTTERPPKQTNLNVLETPKYVIGERQDGVRTIIPDVFYYLKDSHHIILGEVKPWSVTNSDTLKERAAQLCNYDAAMRYNNDYGISSIALVIPELASIRETNNLAAVQEITERQVLIFSVANRDYLARTTKQKMTKLNRTLDFASSASLAQLEKFLSIDINEAKEELKMLERSMSNFDL